MKLATIYAQTRFLNWIWNYNIICFEFCFVFPPMLFLFRVGGCYAVTVDFDLLSGRTCIFILLDEQGHLVGRFELIFVPSAENLKRCAFFLISWCFVTVWPM